MVERSDHPERGEERRAMGPAGGLELPGPGRGGECRETYYDDEGIFYWMERDKEGREPLTWLGNRFPQGCRFCM
jgi:hypothetical protein